jgi:hypothetical protein
VGSDSLILAKMETAPTSILDIYDDTIPLIVDKVDQMSNVPSESMES